MSNRGIKVVYKRLVHVIQILSKWLHVTYVFKKQGSLAKLERLNCKPNQCESSANFDIDDPEDAFPDEVRLAEMCPPIQEMLDCSIGQVEACLGQGLDTLIMSENETLSAIGNILFGASDLFQDLCDPNSRFHKDYVENYACMKEVLMSPFTTGLCALEAKGLYGGFRSETDEDEEEAMCMLTAHVVACVSGELLRECGESARSVMLDTVKRIKLLKLGICSPQHLADLKTTYIDYLELESDRRSIFEKAFDLRRRK